MIRKPKRAALYLRVSRDGQTTENQRLALEAAPRNAVGRSSTSTRTTASPGLRVEIGALALTRL